MNHEEGQRPGRAGEREEKRAQFAGAAGRKGVNTKLVVLVLALACVAGYVVVAGLRGDDAAGPTRTAEVNTTTPAAPGTDAGEVRVPLRDLEGGKAVFFEPKLASGKSVRFFVVKASDNTYRAALDACEVCFHAKKGYQQKGADMICRNCGRSFPVDGIGPHNEGGCHPVALRQRIEGDALVIKTSELEKGVAYF